jgi:hypothetical protein
MEIIYEEGKIFVNFRVNLGVILNVKNHSYKEVECFMEFIKPKQPLGSKVTWSISDQTKALVKYYAEYTGYSQDEVVDTFLKNLLKDEEFMKWIYSKRRNKRALAQIFPENETEGQVIG